MIHTGSALASLVAAVGLAGTALCSGTEIGLYTLNRIRLSIRVAAPSGKTGSGNGGGGGGGGGGGDRAAAWVKQELDHSDRSLTTLLIANTFFGSMAASGVGAIFHNMGFSERQVVLLDMIALTPVLIIGCEIMPKEIFRLEADRLTYRVIGFLRFLRLLLTAVGLIPLVQLLTRALIRALRLGDQVHLASGRERIAALLKEGVSHGILSESQTSLLDRALALRDTTVGDELVPWPRVSTVYERLERSRLLRHIAEHRFSRFPVIDPSGRVVGIVDNLDISLYPTRPVRDLARPALFISARMPVREALRKMGEAGAKLAIVGDTDRPLGIVTAKDLIEPLTGELGAW